MNEKSPYSPPRAALVVDSVPEAFKNGSLPRSTLVYAGWVAIAYLLLSLAVIGLTFSDKAVEGSGLKSLSEALSLVLAIMFIYLILVLKRFLHIRFRLTGIGTYVWILIIISTAFTLIPLFGTPDANNATTTSLFVSSLVCYGIASILLGLKLKTLTYRYLPALGWLLVASGFCLATIVLYLLSIPLGVASDWVLALLFFHAGKEVRSYAAGAPPDPPV